MFDKRLKDFFSVYDENNVFHNGFLQSIDLSAYVDLTILNEITLNIMDSFLKNEIGNMKTMHNWNMFLTWDKDEKKYKINSEFYDTAKYSIYAYLLRSQRFFTLLNTDFRSLSAQETEQIVYGAKEEQKDYDKVVVNIERENDSTIFGQEQLTKSFGIFERETEFGNTRKDFSFGVKEKETEFGNTRKDMHFGVAETETEFGNTRKDLHYGVKETETEFGNTRKDLHYGQKETDIEYGATSETYNTGQQINSSDTTNQTHPFDMNTFLDDTASGTTTTNGIRQDTKSALLHTDTTTEKVHEDYETNAVHTDTTTEKVHDDYELNALHTDTTTEKAKDNYETNATHTDTETEKAHADYETEATHTDTETEKAHTDTETNATHTDTNTYGDITNTTDNRTDTTLIKTHTDTKTRTKIILISPDKYYEIMKELMSYNVYDILIGAIRDCFTMRVF